MDNMVDLDTLNDRHIGQCNMENGILVMQIVDRPTRQQSNLSVFNLNTREDYGNFPWPDPQNSIYFGVGVTSEYLFYFSNYEYFRKINLRSKRIDTIPIKSKISELVNMVIINNKAYSLKNSYGINIVDINNTSKQILIRPFQGSYFNEQNSISQPVSDTLNVVASTEVDSNRYKVFGIDTQMNIKWDKTFNIKDRFVEIRILNTAKGFVMKYDNTIEFISKQEGTTLWKYEFPSNIYNFFLSPSGKLILFLSSNPNGYSIISKTPLTNKAIIGFDLDKKKIDWGIDIGSGGEKAFFTKRYLFDVLNDSEYAKVDPESGVFSRFLYNGKGLEIIRDKVVCKDYLLLDNKMYW